MDQARVHRIPGNPRCWDCQGYGVIWWKGKPRACHCTKPTPQVQAQLRKAQAGRQPFKTLTQLIQEAKQDD